MKEETVCELVERVGVSPQAMQGPMTAYLPPPPILNLGQTFP